MQQTAQRVARILDADRPGATRVWRPALGLVATFSVVCLIVLPRAPKLVAFTVQQPSFAASAFKASPELAFDNAGSQARMIPAAFHAPVSSATLPKNVHAHSAKPRQRISPFNASPVAPLPAKLTQPQQNSVHMVRTSVQTSSQTVDGAQSVLLIMHTEQLDDSGRLVWSISMWQLTVFHPTVPQLQRGINPKTT
jgi:hypothetical protein